MMIDRDELELRIGIWLRTAPSWAKGQLSSKLALKADRAAEVIAKHLADKLAFLVEPEGKRERRGL